ncbi:MAG: hypothetical protein P857_984 [Candidatus Xenolissoclinum pacificiensis L6]|uniref:Uncharacterized protein n=1 Tax=Candidatus Xenolissoclinum pacificiensis L6 TaxID=1401685 RepID=W2V075_9RICK|nr:MAG: hypothetical protein P857_984 [Candidatus Xenolissoclinum pacificiensis L6]
MIYTSIVIREYYILDIAMVYILLSFIILVLWQKVFLYVLDD